MFAAPLPRISPIPALPFPAPSNSSLPPPSLSVFTLVTAFLLAPGPPAPLGPAIPSPFPHPSYRASFYVHAAELLRLHRVLCLSPPASILTILTFQFPLSHPLATPVLPFPQASLLHSSSIFRSPLPPPTSSQSSPPRDASHSTSSCFEPSPLLTVQLLVLCRLFFFPVTMLIPFFPPPLYGLMPLLTAISPLLSRPF